ncbi:uncharacterized protein LOC128173291 isoform X3 [Crassostrea angulata]|uniref:uncharacterized protein LOC128173291 isoform X3 n=1 Tax=Magallana angulata TaxID=2784310 RepID=UPI0022B20EF6|nr:uncharacterized protein LOC128173291 isoform X3 [Crassostrea angulata]
MGNLNPDKMSTKEFISTSRSKLETAIKNNEKELQLLMKETYSQSLHDLKKSKMQITKKLKWMETKWFHGSRFASEECDAKHDIMILDHDINGLEEKLKQNTSRIEDLEKQIEKDKKDLAEKSQVLEGFPGYINSRVLADSLAFFEELSYPISQEIPYINILMIGETGAGKSAFLNTFATALEDSKLVKDIYKTAPKTNGESVTRKMVGASEMRKMKKFINKNPTPADEIHCILYVIRASSNLSTEVSKSFKEIKKVQNSRKGEDDIKQFVIITAIDEIGVPNEDMGYAYQYPCVRKIRDKVADALKILPNCVIPVSNYFFESKANEVKNAMSLMALWLICSSGRDYVQRKSGRNIFPDFF